MMKTNFYNKTLLLGTLVLVLLFTGVLLAFLLFRSIEEERALRESLEVLETGLEAKKQANRQQFDSLQQELNGQEALQLELKTNLRELKKQRKQLNTRYEKKKEDLAGPGAIDSLRDAIARHYRK